MKGQYNAPFWSWTTQLQIKIFDLNCSVAIQQDVDNFQMGSIRITYLCSQTYLKNVRACVDVSTCADKEFQILYVVLTNPGGAVA